MATHMGERRGDLRPVSWRANLPTLHDRITQVAELLPLQGPITAFAFLNPLQGLEHLPFHEALRQAAPVFGCEPYLTENAYREKLQHGRITLQEIQEVLDEDLGDSAAESIAGITTRGNLRKDMLQYPLHTGPTTDLRWIVAETDALRRFRSEMPLDARERIVQETQHWVMRDLSGQLKSEQFSNALGDDIAPALRELADQFGKGTLENWPHERWERLCLSLLWLFCRHRVKSWRAPDGDLVAGHRHRDLLLQATSLDSDQLVHELLIPFCAAYLDQGYAHWRLPNRDVGFFAAFCDLYATPARLAHKWRRHLALEIARIRAAGLTPLECVAESLDLLGVTVDESTEYLTATLLALRGWTGMIWQTEVRPDRVCLASPPGTVIEFLAARLLLERLAITHLAAKQLGTPQQAGPVQQVGNNCPLASLRQQLVQHMALQPELSADQIAFQIFQLSQIEGWLPRTIAELPPASWSQLVDEVVSFSGLERRRLFHAAYERHLAKHVLDAVAVRTGQPPVSVDRPDFQVVTCIDAREESFRRHLEEIAPQVETYGTAGFFGVAMYYRGTADAHFTALCPVVVKPLYWMVDDVVHSLEDVHRQRVKARRVFGTASHSFNVGTRSSVLGAFLSTLLGPLATAPLVSRILFPRLTANMQRTARQFVQPPTITRLRLERVEGEAPGPDDAGIGFSLDEMINMSERALRDIGLTQKFGRIILFLGHGSTCLNNPHESAYHCGACSGSPGGPNARAIAAMLNDRRVRRALQGRGLDIPEDVYFLGGLHNTATDAITFYDLELIPSSHIRPLRELRDVLSRACERNAHERCRRFESAKLDLNPREALLHVQNRSEDLAQTRPEYGNSTNAVCFVGRRERIRGMFMDRRSFLMSYDPTQDDERSTILARILAAVIPVCEGINLLYTLSAIDNYGWGSGTKLPHNVTSLLGVMEGAASDLRPGLPWQGVDIHEAVRLLFIIETSPESMARIMDENPLVGRICRNGWVQLALLDRNSNTLLRFHQGSFHPYHASGTGLAEAESSLEWYRGWRDHLPFARIRGGGPVDEAADGVIKDSA